MAYLILQMTNHPAISFFLHKVQISFLKMFPGPLCNKMFPALAGQTVKFLSLSNAGHLELLQFRIMATAKVRLGLDCWGVVFLKALNQSTLMDDLCLTCTYGLVWLEHLSLFCQQQIKLLHIFARLTQLPVIDNTPAMHVELWTL